jgi:geranylgeranyl pyrophosphate synthase
VIAARSRLAPALTLAELLRCGSLEASEAHPWRELRERALFEPLAEFLGRPSKMLRARIVEVGFVVAGGAAGALPSELPLVIEALHAGSLIVDDIEDESVERRGGAALHAIHGVPVALNAGNWLYFWPQVLLSRAPLPPLTRLHCHERLVRCLLRCHEGQAVDLTARVEDLPRRDVAGIVRAITDRKTAGLFELASALGALAAGADGRRVDAIAAFGLQAGVWLQMLDDLSGVLAPARRHEVVEDLSHGRATWVWAWLAETLDAESYARLLDGLGSAARTRRWAALVQRIRTALGEAPLSRPRAQLDAAMVALRAAGADDVTCRRMRGDLSNLERAYVGV